MAFVFISYQSADQEVAERLKHYLDETLQFSSFLSCDPHDGIAVGKKWPPEVCEHLEHSEVVCILVSSKWITSQYCDDEYRLARYFNKRIFTLALDADDRVNKFLEQEIGYENYLSCSMTDTTRAFKSLKASLETLASESRQSPFTFQGLNPYKGLLSYEEEDAAVFFGRDEERKKMVDTILGMPHKEHKLYVLYGSSGTGKSSLLRAGVLPYLRKEQEKKWAILPLLTPSIGTLNTFTRMLSDYLEKDRSDLEVSLEKCLQDSRNVEQMLLEIEAVHQKKYGIHPAYVLLTIDQLEVLFSDTANDTLFIHMLTVFLSHPRVYVVTTLRSDFLYEFQTSPIFTAFKNKNAIKFEVMHPIAKYKISEIIKSPERLPELRGRLEIDDLFVEKVKDDLDGLDDVLPLLSLLLSNLYEKHNGKLKESTYTQGELAELINTMAEEAIANWIDDEVMMERLKHIFVHHMVRVSENQKVVKVKALRSNFPNELDEPIEALVKSRLLLSFSENASQSKIKKIEIAHEALIRHWTRLAKWVEKERDFLIIRQEVEQAFVIWTELKEEKEALFAGVTLKRILSDSVLENKFYQTNLYDYVQQSITYFKLQRNKRRAFISGSFLTMTGLALFGNVQYFRAKSSEEVLKDEIRKTRHNIGLLFADRASHFLGQKKVTRAKLYANYALQTMDVSQIGIEQKMNKMVGILRCFNEVKCAYIEDGYENYYIKVVGTEDLSKIYASMVDGNILVSDTKNGKSRTLFSNVQKHRGRIYDMKLSSDKQTLVTASADKHIKVVKLDTLDITTLDAVHNDRISSVIFMDSDRKLISASYDTEVIVWDLETLNPIEKIASYHSKPIRALALSKDERFLFSASYDKTIGVYDVKEKQFLYRLEGHQAKVNRVIIHPEKSDILFSSSDDGTVKEWTLGRNEKNHSKTLLKSEHSIFDIQISSDAKRLYVTSEDKTITIWNLERNSKEMVLDAHKSYSSSVAISEDNSTLVTTSWDKTIRYWDMAYFLVNPVLQKSHHGKVTALSKNNQALYATGGDDNTIKIWDAKKKVVLQTLYGHNNAVYDLVFYDNQKKLISASRDQTIRVWDLENQSISHLINRHKGRIYSLSLDKSQRYFASGSQDRMVYVYDLKDENNIVFSANHPSDVFHVTFINERFLCSTSENVIYLWDILSKSDKPLYKLANHHDKIYDFVYDEKLKYAYSCSKDGEILQWNLEADAVNCQKPTIAKRFEGHISNVYNLALSSEGTKLVSADAKQNIKVWDTSKAEVLKTLHGHTHRIYHISLLKDDKTLISTSWDGTVRVWDIENNVKKGTESLQILREYPDCSILSINPLKIKSYDDEILHQDEIAQNIVLLEKELQVSLKNTIAERRNIPYVKPVWSKYHPFWHG